MTLYYAIEVQINGEWHRQGAVALEQDSEITPASREREAALSVLDMAKNLSDGMETRVKRITEAEYINHKAML